MAGSSSVASQSGRLGRILRAILGSGEPFDWTDQDTEVAAQAVLLPAIWPTVQSGLVRCDTQDQALLWTAHEQSTARSIRIERQVVSVARKLNEIGVRPMIFKGAAHLLTGLWPTPGSRIFSDIDLLVSDENYKQSDQVLADWAGDTNPRQEWHPKHLEPVWSPSLEAAIEVHRAAIPGPLIDTKALLDTGVSMSANGAQWTVPDPEHAVLIAMAHGPLSHHDPYVLPRDILDIAFLQERHAVDPEQLAARLRRIRRDHIGTSLNRQFCVLLRKDPPVKPASWATRLVHRVEHYAWLKYKRGRLGTAIWLIRELVRHLADGPDARRELKRYLLERSRWHSFLVFFTGRAKN